MYDALALWWPLLSAPADYEEEAGFYADALVSACDQPPRTLLELGSGGGNNASHMKTRFDMVLVEPSAGMRAVSLALNPGIEHVDGDMRTARLGRQFDGVFVHDAVCYMTTESDLRTRVEHDRHFEGLLRRADWLRLLSETGFEARAVPFEHSELEPGAHEVFVAKRRA